MVEPFAEFTAYHLCFGVEGILDSMPAWPFPCGRTTTEFPARETWSPRRVFPGPCRTHFRILISFVSRLGDDAPPEARPAHMQGRRSETMTDGNG